MAQEYPKVSEYAIPTGSVYLPVLVRHDSGMEEMTREQRLLGYLRDTYCGGVAAELARKLGHKNPSYINRAFYPEGKAGRKGIGLELMRQCSEAFDLPRGWWDSFDLDRAPVQGTLLGEEVMPQAKPQPALATGVPEAAAHLIALMAEIVEPLDDEGRKLAAEAFAALLKNPQNQHRAALTLAGAMANDVKPPPAPAPKTRKTAAPQKSAPARKGAAFHLEVKPGGGQQLLIERLGIKPLREIVRDEHAGEDEQRLYKRFANYPKAVK